MKKIFFIVLIFTILTVSFMTLMSCSDNSNKMDGWDKYTKGEFGIKNENNPLVEIKFSTGDTVRLELYPDVAPKTVANFIKLAKSGSYNGLTMHRIIENFMIQGGGYTRRDNILEDAFGSSAKNIYGEFAANGWANNIRHQKGVISMARANSYNSASTQFFICSVDCNFLDGYYCAFGRVIDVESMNSVVKISKVVTGGGHILQGGMLYQTTDVPTDIINIVSVEIRE